MSRNWFAGLGLLLAAPAFGEATPPEGPSVRAQAVPGGASPVADVVDVGLPEKRQSAEGARGSFRIDRAELRKELREVREARRDKFGERDERHRDRERTRERRELREERRDARRERRGAH